MKHRTQILLEPWQYQALREEAARLKISFSSLIRSGIDRILRSAQSRRGDRRALNSFAGIIKGEKTRLTNSAIDRIVYHRDWK